MNDLLNNRSHTASSPIRRALITGASEGIGRVFAIKLAQQGYTITAVARNEGRLDSLMKELHGSGHSRIVADLSKNEGILAVGKELTSVNKYTILVNNAGFGKLGDFCSLSMALYTEMMTLNMNALVTLSHAFLSRAEKGDGVIQVSSTLSLLPLPNQSVYSATKAFVTSFSESLWYQYRKKGVMILNLCPGSTKTLFSERSGGQPGSVPESVTETPEQVVDAALRAYAKKCGPTLVSGWKNRFAVLLARLASRRLIVKTMGLIRQ